MTRIAGKCAFAVRSPLRVDFDRRSVSIATRARGMDRPGREEWKSDGGAVAPFPGEEAESRGRPNRPCILNGHVGTAGTALHGVVEKPLLGWNEPLPSFRRHCRFCCRRRCSSLFGRNPLLGIAPRIYAPLPVRGLRVAYMGLLKKSPEAGNGFPVGEDLRVLPSPRPIPSGGSLICLTLHAQSRLLAPRTLTLSRRVSAVSKGEGSRAPRAGDRV